MNHSNQKRHFRSKAHNHYYLLTYLVIWGGEEGRPGGAQYVNVQVERDQQTLPLKFLGQTQEAAASNMVQLGVNPQTIKQVVLMGSTYLGRMTEAEMMEGLDPQGIQEEGKEGELPPSPILQQEEPGTSASEIADKLFLAKH